MSDTFQRLVKVTVLPCREDPELFFDAETALGEPNEYTKEAKELCMSCSIRYSCLTEALENGETSGVWGGMTTSERGAMGIEKIAA